MATTTEEQSPTPRFLAFSQRISNELNIVSIDHCYAKPWSSHPDASNACPLHMLFMEKFPRSSSMEKQRSPDIIDIEAEDDSIPPMYDVGKARAMMADCERHAALLRPDYADNRDDWEDHIAAVRTSWSALQNRIFAKVTRVLQADRLARLSIQGTKNEPIQRRLQIDKAAKRVRFSFANVGWDMTLILWLHNLFLENLRGQLLTSYLEVLQTLKAKIPSLVDRLIQGTTTKPGGFAIDSLGGLLKRNWDPVLLSINQQKLKKLPDSPLLLMISNAPSSAPNPVAIKRHKFWQHQLSAMGKVINVVPINNSTSITIANCVENMIATTRSKILEMKGQFPGRPIILIGWQVGALVATHVALMEVVHGVVCLGFPTMGVYGNRGEIDDQIYNCKTPTLFVVGQHASSCSLDTLEDIREKLRVETGLLLVGGADDQLRMSRAKKRSCGVTQAMVDRCIMDEMFEFLGNILSQIVVQPETIEDVDVSKRPRKRKQKDVTAAAGSQTGMLPKQPSMKTVKAMKLANAGAVAFSGQSALTTGPKLAKRAAPKKRAPKTGESSLSSKKPMLHLSFPMITTSGDQSPALSKVSEAAAIASAPELSNLLQSIKTSDQQKLSTSVSSALTSKPAVPSSSTTIATTTALTLSRFLASSGFFRTSSVLKGAEDSGTSPVKSSSDGLTDQTSTESSQLLDDSSLKQPQILIRTGASSAPFSIPLTFSLANKVSKSAPVMRITGTSSSTPHIQQLLTSVSASSLPLVTTSSAANLPTSVPSSSLFQSPSVTLNSLSTLSPHSLGLVSPASTSPASTYALVNNPSPTVGTGTLSPGASVINIGSDTVFMKEAPSSTTSVPGTVSIDLGQIATGASSSVMKLTSAPKISLIPAMKQIPISGSSEKLLLTTPLTGSQPSIATLSSLSQSQQSHLTKPTSTVTQLKPLHQTSADSYRTLTTTLTTSPLKTIAGMSSSQLLSTLSTSAGLITLKLPPSSVKPSTEGSLGKDEPDGQTKGNDPTLTQLRGSISLHTHSLTFTPSTAANTSTLSRLSDPQQQNLQSVSSAVSQPMSGSPTSLIITPGNKMGTGQIVLHCRGTPASLSQPSPVKPSSPKMLVTTPSETLGQVTSLLESSPVTMGDHRKSHTIGSPGPTTTKQTNKTPSSPSASSPLSSSSSSSSVSSQGQPGSSKSSKTTISSYTATSKPVLPTIASTRTRRIKTPKQYDL